VTFRGWPGESLEFYEGLEADNSRTYWAARKVVYEEKVHGPMAELIAELEPEFGPSKIFRPYRDVRFSADKSPYKTAIGATLGAGYIQLSANGLAAGRGMYVMDRDQLQRYRDAVVDDRTGRELERVIAAVTSHRIDVLGHESLKTAPRGYPKDHPRVELLRHKGLVAWKEWPVAGWLATSEPRKRIVTFLRDSQPLSDWLSEHVGPTEATLP
jgi:uncharacterized protein (TIGR02453 family)